MTRTIFSAALLGALALGGAVPAQAAISEDALIGRFSTVQCPNDLIGANDLVRATTGENKALVALYVSRAEDSYDDGNIQKCEDWLRQAANVASTNWRVDLG